MNTFPPDKRQASQYQSGSFVQKDASKDLASKQREDQNHTLQEDPRHYTPVLDILPAKGLNERVPQGNQPISRGSQRRTTGRVGREKTQGDSVGDFDEFANANNEIKKIPLGIVKNLQAAGRKLLQLIYWFRPFNLLRFLGAPIISRYIIAEFMFSFFISFVFFFFIFLVNALLLVARKYAGEGLPLWAILRLIYYNIPTNVSLSLPFSVLVGALMAISHLGASNQMLAFRTCSVRRSSILIPLLICSFIAAIGSFIFSDYFLPLGRINTQKTVLQLLSNNPKVIINPYSVRSFRSENGRNTYIVSGLVNSNTITELFIVDYDQDLNRRIFFAKTARLADNRPTGVVPFVLNGVNATIASNVTPQKYSYMSANSLLYNVLLGDVTETYHLTPDDRQSWELIRTLHETELEQAETDGSYDTRTAEYRMHYRSVYKGLYLTTDDTLTKDRLKVAYSSLIDRPNNFYDDKIFTYKIALYLRLAISFSCIPFMVLAFSLGSLAKRYGRSIGFLLGLLLSGIFWFSLTGGRLLGRSNSLEIPPFLLMFASNIIFLILGALLILRQRN